MDADTKEKLMVAGAALVGGAALLPVLSFAGGKTENVGGKAGPYLVPGVAALGGVALATLVDCPIARGAGVALAALGGYMVVATVQASKAASQAATATSGFHQYTGNDYGHPNYGHPGARYYPQHAGAGGAHGGGGGGAHGGHGGGGRGAAPRGAGPHGAPHGGHGGHGHPLHPHPGGWGGGAGFGWWWPWWGPGWTYYYDAGDCTYVLDPSGNEWCVWEDGSKRMTRSAAQVAATTRTMTSGPPPRPLNWTGSGSLPPAFARRITGLHRTWAHIRG
jgi:hypothetical protein